MLRALPIAVAFLLLAGCPCVATDVAYVCHADADCAPGKSCVAGYCGSPTGTSGGTTGASGTGAQGSGTGGTSAGATGAQSTSGGATTGGTTTGGSTTGAGTARILAGAQVNASGVAQVWDVTNPQAAAELFSSGLPADLPISVAIAADGEVFVESPTDVVSTFDAQGNYLGEIEVAGWQGSTTGSSVLFLPGDGGGTVVLCDLANGIAGLSYAGPGDFDGGTALVLTPRWRVSGGAPVQCSPGPANTFFAAELTSVAWYTADGQPYNTGNLLPSTAANLLGVAMDPESGHVLVAGGDPENDGGIAELFDSQGVCLGVITAGACGATDCATAGSCVPNASLPGDLATVVALPGGSFLATYDATASNPQNDILRLDFATPSVSTYYAGPSGLSFYGLATGP